MGDGCDDLQRDQTPGTQTAPPRTEGNPRIVVLLIRGLAYPWSYLSVGLLIEDLGIFHEGRHASGAILVAKLLGRGEKLRRRLRAAGT